MKKKLVCAALFSIAVAGLPSLSIAKSVTVDEDTLLALQEMIKKQQAQLDSQAKAIAAMQDKLIGQDTKIANIPAATEKGGGFIIPGTDKATVKLSGQVNRAVMFADDGHQDEVLFVDNDNSSTRISLKGNVKANEEWSAGSDFEVEYQTNDSNSISMDNQSFDSGFKRRKLDFHLLSKTYGKLSLGHGQAASDDTAEADLSATSVIGYSSVSSNGGGFKFYDNNTQSYNGSNSVKVSSAFSNLDGLSRIDRVRYDTPSLNGFTLSTSFGEDNASDAAVRYKNKFENFTVDTRVGWAYMKADTQDEDQLSGSASILFNNGFNLTVAAGNKSKLAAGRDDASFYYGKIGQKFNFCALGSTLVSLDYGKYEDQAANNDDGDAYGVQFVQNITKLSSELYLGYRLFSLDRDNTDYEDISSLMSGFRFKF